MLQNLQKIENWTMKTQMKTAIVSVAGTLAAIAIGFFGSAYVGRQATIGLAVGMFGVGAIAATRNAISPDHKQPIVPQRKHKEDS